MPISNLQVTLKKVLNPSWPFQLWTPKSVQFLVDYILHSCFIQSEYLKASRKKCCSCGEFLTKCNLLFMPPHLEQYTLKPQVHWSCSPGHAMSNGWGAYLLYSASEAEHLFCIVHLCWASLLYSESKAEQSEHLCFSIYNWASLLCSSSKAEHFSSILHLSWASLLYSASKLSISALLLPDWHNCVTAAREKMAVEHEAGCCKNTQCQCEE